MKTNKKETFQKEFDLQKWVESEQAGHDKCGEYDFCANCDKSLPTPCAEAKFASDGMTLKESLTLATEEKSASVGKKYVADYLKKTFGTKVEINCRANKITSGKLPLADTHYVLGNKKTCFIYVYETEDGGTLFLVKASATLADQLKKSHAKVYKSAFPKSKAAWYTVVVDKSFTKKDVDNLLSALVKENA